MFADERRQGRLRVQGRGPGVAQVRHDPARRPRTTAPRSPRRSTAPTASTAASPTRTGPSFLPAMAVARRHAAAVRPPGQPQRADRRAVPGADPGRHLRQRLPEHRRSDVGRLPRRRSRSTTRPDLDWNSLAGLGTWAAFEAFVAVVQGMDGEITTTRSSRPPTRRRRSTPAAWSPSSTSARRGTAWAGRSRGSSTARSRSTRSTTASSSPTDDPPDGHDRRRLEAAATPGRG